jgi:MarR-like DNA-binding transcriptional regulator SgrR of sgrS sRNA
MILVKSTIMHMLVSNNPKEANMTDHERLLTKNEVARRWNCSKRTLDRLRVNGILPWLDLSNGRGGKPLVRFRISDIQAYEGRNRMAPLEKGVRENVRPGQL